MIANNVFHQQRQCIHNKPRIGFAHSCYGDKMGEYFQKVIKNGVIEKLLNKAWKGLIRYRCNFHGIAYREGLKHPEQVFVYDDPLFELIDSTLKQTASDYCTDIHRDRKVKLVNQALDVALSIGFEDIYYRPLMKKMIDNLIMAAIEHPELFDLDIEEQRTVQVINYAEAHTNRKKRERIFRELIKRAEHDSI